MCCRVHCTLLSLWGIYFVFFLQYHWYRGGIDNFKLNPVHYIVSLWLTVIGVKAKSNYLPLLISLLFLLKIVVVMRDIRVDKTNRQIKSPEFPPASWFNVGLNQFKPGLILVKQAEGFKLSFTTWQITVSLCSQSMSLGRFLQQIPSCPSALNSLPHFNWSLETRCARRNVVLTLTIFSHRRMENSNHRQTKLCSRSLCYQWHTIAVKDHIRPRNEETWTHKRLWQSSCETRMIKGTGIIGQWESLLCISGFGQEKNRKLTKSNLIISR